MQSGINNTLESIVERVKTITDKVSLNRIGLNKTAATKFPFNAPYIQREYGLPAWNVGETFDAYSTDHTAWFCSAMIYPRNKTGDFKVFEKKIYAYFKEIEEQSAVHITYAPFERFFGIRVDIIVDLKSEFNIPKVPFSYEQAANLIGSIDFTNPSSIDFYRPELCLLLIAAQSAYNPDDKDWCDAHADAIVTKADIERYLKKETPPEEKVKILRRGCNRNMWFITGCPVEEDIRVLLEKVLRLPICYDDPYEHSHFTFRASGVPDFYIEVLPKITIEGKRLEPSYFGDDIVIKPFDYKRDLLDMRVFLESDEAAFPKYVRTTRTHSAKVLCLASYTGEYYWVMYVNGKYEIRLLPRV